jgi:two-component system nitrate/nitrite response regulator NarL
VANIILISNNHILSDQWKTILSMEHNIRTVTSIIDAANFIHLKTTDILIIDADVLDSNETALNQIKNMGIKTLIVGRNWSEDKQIQVLVSGMSGYCEHEDALNVLLKATESIFMGDIWMQRHLVPKVIGQLVSLTTAKTIASKETASINKSVQQLTHRELDVARMICAGKSNKVIATLLNISERTVKAHLTSIFQKLEVQDRLHLAILLRDNI